MKYLCILLLAIVINLLSSPSADAFSCPNIHVLFARGSGQEYGRSEEFRMYSANVRREIPGSEFIEIRYPAVAVNFNSIVTDTVFSARNAYSYNESVSAGRQALANETVRIANRCPRSFIALIGFSQGAQVIGDLLPHLTSHAHRIIYTALLGDPRLNLPEGRGLNPPACPTSRGTNHSIYRAYAPNCHTDNGILSARNPYLPEPFRAKGGTYCANRDLICGSSKNPFVNDGHQTYSNQRIVNMVIENIESRIPNNQQAHTPPPPTTTAPPTPRFPRDFATVFFIDPCYVHESKREIQRILALRTNRQIMAVLPMSALYDDEHGSDAFLEALNNGQPNFSQRLFSYLPATYTDSQRLLLVEADAVARRAPCVVWSEEHRRGGVPSRFMEYVNPPAATTTAMLIYPFLNGQTYISEGRSATIATCLKGFYGTEAFLCAEQRQKIDVHYRR